MEYFAVPRSALYGLKYVLPLNICPSFIENSMSLALSNSVGDPLMMVLEAV